MTGQSARLLYNGKLRRARLVVTQDMQGVLAGMESDAAGLRLVGGVFLAQLVLEIAALPIRAKALVGHDGLRGSHLLLCHLSPFPPLWIEAMGEL